MGYSELGIVKDTPTLCYTVRKYNTLLTTSTYNITLAPDAMTFKPVAPGSLLEEGNYFINFYLITAGDSSATISSVGQVQTVKVTNAMKDGAKFSYRMIKQEAAVSGTLPKDILPSFFEFYWNGKKIDAGCISGWDKVDSSSGKTYVRSVTFDIPNTVYGSYTVTAQLQNALITIK